MTVIKVIITGILSVFCISTAALAKNKDAQSEVVIVEDVRWGYLNPLRGDKSPGAADLWGDRTKSVATGMLVRFNQGFSSPPHIHNITYRGVVIKGMMHNDTPNAEKMWMPPGSFWMQPAGQNHITAANGKANLIYLEIDKGPYLVEPSAEHFDNGERPINQHKSNIVWLNQDDSTWVKGGDVEITALWENADKLRGSMIKIPAGFNGKLKTDASEFRVVVITGEVMYKSKETTEPKKLLPGSYFSSTGKFQHMLSASEPSTLYIRSGSDFHVSQKR